eukprot:TRINITY_DN2815_c0_g1_i5.p1 TRINITY_DN2815_c0_g1~~TRINITY_DN2815_c0_g1_i5.p1  ORF type:complete len:212 (-),score=41.19 TRINITY_DN2815_c0_g1_i5:55-690(-)
MKVPECILFSPLGSVVTAQQQQYNYDDYDPYNQQYQPQQEELYNKQSYQTESYNQQPYPSDRYDTQPYQPDPYQPTPQQYQPAPYKPAPAPYKPATAPYKPQKAVHPAHYQEEEEDYPPQPFAYEYGGADSSGRHFAKTETSDDDGVVRGEYRVELPDGRVQIVSYTADHVNGYQADVRYEGEAKPYVPEPQEYDQPRQKYVPQHKPYSRY